MDIKSQHRPTLGNQQASTSALRLSLIQGKGNASFRPHFAGKHAIVVTQKGAATFLCTSTVGEAKGLLLSPITLAHSAQQAADRYEPSSPCTLKGEFVGIAASLGIIMKIQIGTTPIPKSAKTD